MLNLADWLVTDPAVFVATAEYVPTSATVTETSVNVAPVALGNGEPSFNH